VSTRTPPGLGPRGKALWRYIVDANEVPVHELGLLLEACRTSDDLDALAKVIRADGPMLDGKPHPALVEARQLRIVLSRLTASLRVPDEDDTRPQRRGAARGNYA
jgi:hypothetical protein